MNQIKNEPNRGFPYQPPSNEIKEKYAHIFNLKKPVEERFLKLLFDKIIALL